MLSELTIGLKSKSEASLRIFMHFDFKSVNIA